jgi:hypothetical protein
MLTVPVLQHAAETLRARTQLGVFSYLTEHSAQNLQVGREDVSNVASGLCSTTLTGYPFSVLDGR